MHDPVDRDRERKTWRPILLKTKKAIDMENAFDDDFELIDKHLTGKLTAEEAEVFNENMKNMAFRKEVTLRKELLEVIEFEGNTGIKAMLQAEESSLKKAASGRGAGKIRRIQLRRLAAAAASLLLLGALWWFFIKPAPSDIFAENFEPYRNTLDQADRSPGEATRLKESFQFYENKDYKKALTGFETFLENNPDDDVAFYQANTLLQLGKTTEAAQVLRQIIENGTTVYLDQSKWYLALAFIRLEDPTAAKPLLHELENSPFYKEKATRLLRKL